MLNWTCILSDGTQYSDPTPTVWRTRSDSWRCTRRASASFRRSITLQPPKKTVSLHHYHRAPCKLWRDRIYAYAVVLTSLKELHIEITSFRWGKNNVRMDYKKSFPELSSISSLVSYNFCLLPDVESNPSCIAILQSAIYILYNMVNFAKREKLRSV